MKTTKVFLMFVGIITLILGFSAKFRGVTSFQERLGKNINIDGALFAEDTKTPPAKSAQG